ncbi:uncharacterized protein I303_106224 [Kwoniella dejecticola CBS 10117]|uniref:Biotin transporter n=1 Tax=Kwoniella dejecticola CBS 10117 TaxID=1296121 RepID=A0AAJ8MJ44_9TREE
MPFDQYLDQTNITNAYVSGMKEDLNAGGNDLNYFNVAYYTACTCDSLARWDRAKWRAGALEIDGGSLFADVVGQWPLIALQSKPRLAPYLLPTMEIIWAVLTFCQARVTKVWHLYIIRALLGFFSAPSFGGTHLVLGSWYKQEELFKRAGVWFMGNSVGQMFSGYLQAAAYNNLSGVNGYSGWKWLFIINGIITLPISFLGFAVFPGLINSPKKWYFTETEFSLAKSRLSYNQGSGDSGVTIKTVKNVVRKPMFWICVATYICMIQAHYWEGYMVLWLKADTNLSISLINILPTFSYLISALSSWLGTTLAGKVSRPGLWTFQASCSVFSLILMNIWNIPNGLKFFAFYFTGISAMASPIFYSWINSTMRDNPAERALIISTCMTMGYCTYIWVPLFTFPTVEAPRFRHGYPPSLVFSVAEWGLTFFGMWYMGGKALQGPDKGEPASEQSSEGVRTPEVEQKDRELDELASTQVIAKAHSTAVLS